MKFTLLKTCLLSTCVGLGSVAFAADENIEVTPLQNVTGHELAAIYVLSELCPKIVKDQEKFSAGYAKLAKEYLPTAENPVETLEQLSQQTNFKSILDEAKSDAKNAGDAKNKEICQELTTYSN
jgi:hypothetical protein